MDVLVPVDRSECSTRAVRFAAEFARRYDASLDVVHLTDVEGEDTRELSADVEAVLAEEGLDGGLEVLTDAHLSDLRVSDRIGRDVIELVEERGYDHVVMGHHGTGRVGEAILGSAAKTAVEAGEFPVTVVP